MEIEVSLPLDEDGFLSRESPFCKRRFKMEQSTFEESESEELYCPYCGQTADVDDFWTPKQVGYMEEKAQSEVVEPEIGKFMDELEKIGRKSDFIDVETNTSKNANPTPPEERNENMREVHFSCCDMAIKVQPDWGNSLHCIFCGESHKHSKD